MEIKQLRCFERVAELGGFSKAAEALSVTQPALSRLVRQLEIELRQALLVRNGRGVRLTDEGVILLAHAKGILQQVDRARQEMDDLKDSPSGSVILGCSPSVGTAAVAKLFQAFNNRFPKASLEIIDIKGWTIEWLLSGRLDIGVLYNPPRLPSIEATSLVEHELYLVSSSDRTTLKRAAPVSARQLGNYPLILPTRPRYIRVLAEETAANLGIKLNVAHQIEGSPFILELIVHGYGHTLLPRHVVEQSRLADKLQINRIINPRLKGSLSIAVSTQRRITRLTQETVNLIKEHLLYVKPCKS